MPVRIDQLKFKSLEQRIVALLLVLLLGVQFATFFIINSAIDRNGRALIAEEVVVGERVFQRLLRQNAEMFTQGAQLMAKDYGFLSAIASRDEETIASVLTNHGDRIGASVTVLVDTERTMRTGPEQSVSVDVQRLILSLVDIAAQKGSAVGTGIVDDAPFQIVVVPVKAPAVVGWVAMAFPIDQRLASDMRDLSSLEVSILTRSAQDKWQVSATTLSPENKASLLRTMNARGSSQGPSLDIGEKAEAYRGTAIDLARNETQTAVAVLQRSVAAATAPYDALQLMLLVLTAGVMVVAAIFSVLTARRITGPLRELTSTARRLGAGDYDGPLPSSGGEEILELSNAFASMRNGISKREMEIHKLAYWDGLTDLPNRAQFTRKLAHALETAQTCHILMMDLDRFKNVNDVMGHSFGDALLRNVGRRLVEHAGVDGENIARLGGDEFAIMLINATLDDARAVAGRVLKSLEKPISLDDQAVDMGAGIGIASYPEHGRDAESLLSRVEVAMHLAKRSGNQAVVYDPAHDEGSQQSLSLLSELRHAVDHNELRLYVQPKLSLDLGEVHGLEALVRWVHPERGMVFPDQFIPFSEQTGFIRVLTLWVLDQAAALCARLAGEGMYPRISVNISARDLMDQDLAEKFTSILCKHGVAAASFCLEITESAIMDDPLRAQNTLNSLHALGTQLSIDDFGTGYSSLAYLKQLPVHELKIDKSFVKNMAHDANDAKIVRSTVDLGHNMGLRVVAEGIETEQVWNLLSEMGCDSGQGYYMSRPIPAEEFSAWSRRWTSEHGVASVAGRSASMAAAMEIQLEQDA
jgi:diguanylate cyclase (GGDEF)-like protein